MPQTRLYTSYENPDLDGVASAVGLQELRSAQNGESSIVRIIGTPLAEVEWVVREFGIALPEQLAKSDVYTNATLLDQSTGDVPGLDNTKVDELFDHREKNHLEDFPNLIPENTHIELVGAAATLIAEEFYKTSSKSSRDVAILLSAAIASNTINFQSPNTTDRDKKMFIALTALWNPPHDFLKRFFVEKTPLDGKLLHEAISRDASTAPFGTALVTIGQLEVFGVRDLLEKRLGEILEALEKVAIEEVSGNDPHYFLNLIDVEAGANYLITNQTAMQKLLSQVFKVEFRNNFVQLPKLLMRKHIAKAIRDSGEVVKLAW